jgi:hypothetical protein
VLYVIDALKILDMKSITNGFSPFTSHRQAGNAMAMFTKLLNLMKMKTQLMD